MDLFNQASFDYRAIAAIHGHNIAAWPPELAEQLSIDRTAAYLAWKVIHRGYSHDKALKKLSKLGEFALGRYDHHLAIQRMKKRREDVRLARLHAIRTRGFGR